MIKNLGKEKLIKMKSRDFSESSGTYIFVYVFSDRKEWEHIVLE